ncbi:sel1 repeat family protein [Xylophilus sp.]|uniref:sel1 repeat family protein n=1 Tax=Xylophilus sp. TaxID=2653893 RepID=UPI0013B8817D|nr:sel1 repeat family protein [Xylophilus sp.]KAF1044203.1 MAG: hypothetical protein GAK38_03632 [Xylophilus sp.]
MALRSFPSPLPRRLAALAFATAALPAAAAPQAVPTPEQAYQLALEARTERDYPAMLRWLRQSAAGGDAGAQEMLAGVLLAGPALHGGQVAAAPCEAAHWSRAAAEQGSPIGRYNLAVIGAASHAACRAADARGPVSRPGGR